MVESDITGAARLLAERHARHRAAQPLLSARCEDREVTERLVTEAWKADDASGAVAVADGRTVGFLLGAPKPSATWGANTWVESGGLALHPSADPEVMRELYALAAARWVDEGRRAHYVLVPAHDGALLRAWYRLGFGQQHAHGIRAVPHEPTPHSPGVTVRRAAPADIPVLARLDVELPAHQRRSPVFSAAPVPTLEECAADWEESFDDPDFAYLVAQLDGQVAGTAVCCALEKSSMHRGPAAVEGAGYLGFAAVLPELRGRGVARSLCDAVLDWCREQGPTALVTDWRVTNLLSSRTWPALGFEETFLRLHRVVGY